MARSRCRCICVGRLVIHGSRYCSREPNNNAGFTGTFEIDPGKQRPGGWSLKGTRAFFLA